jgi:hypothetical protein
MAVTNRYGIPLLDPSTADKTAQMNEIINKMEAIFGGWAYSRTTTVPTPTPIEGDVYIVPDTGATGVWAGQAKRIAHYVNGAWSFYDPPPGANFLVEDQSFAIYTWDSNALIWKLLSGTSTGGGGILSVAADPTPTLGGDLNGADRIYYALRLGSERFNATTKVLTTRPGYSYYGTASDCTASIQNEAPQGRAFGLRTETSRSVLVQPEVGCTLIDENTGTTITRARTAGPYRRMTFECMRNPDGSSAFWLVGGTFLTS